MRLELQQLSLSYDGAPALRGIDLLLPGKGISGIAGHTGCGKSSLLKVLAGLLPPSSGQLLIDGRPACAPVPGLGLLFQYPEQQLFANTVFDDVAFAPRNQGLPESQVEVLVHKALHKVGMDTPSILERDPFALSGGQRRRVALAGVLATQPQLLLLDEPCAGLDPAGQDYLKALIRSLAQQGMGIIMCSHSMDDLASLCDRIVVLQEGAVLLDGKPDAVFSQAELLRSCGLGLPRAQEAAAELRAGGLDLASGFYADEEELADAIVAALHGKGSRHD